MQCASSGRNTHWRKTRGFLLIDARNVFNEENRTAMLWDVRQKWPSGAQFTFKYYRHWATLVVRDIGDGSGQFLQSKEGVTQGYPLAMISYGIRVIALSRELRGSHFRVTQPLYADDTGAGGKFEHILSYLQYLQAQGLQR